MAFTNGLIRLSAFTTFLFQPRPKRYVPFQYDCRWDQLRGCSGIQNNTNPVQKPLDCCCKGNQMFISSIIRQIMWKITCTQHESPRTLSCCQQPELQQLNNGELTQEPGQLSLELFAGPNTIDLARRYDVRSCRHM